MSAERHISRGIVDGVRGIEDGIRGVLDGIRGLIEDSARGLDDLRTGLADHTRGVEDRFRGLQDGIRGVQDGIRGVKDRIRGFEDLIRGLEDHTREIQACFRVAQDGIREAEDFLRVIEDHSRSVMAIQDPTASYKPNFTPAARSFIHGLKKVRLDSLEEAVIRETPRCAICLENFAESVEQLITCLPCKHFFHVNCIILCLEINHICPMCRYQMPTLEAGEPSTNDEGSSVEAAETSSPCAQDLNDYCLARDRSRREIKRPIRFQ